MYEKDLHDDSSKYRFLQNNKRHGFGERKLQNVSKIKINTTFKFFGKVASLFFWKFHRFTTDTHPLSMIVVPFSTLSCVACNFERNWKIEYYRDDFFTFPSDFYSEYYVDKRLDTCKVEP